MAECVSERQRGMIDERQREQGTALRARERRPSAENRAASQLSRALSACRGQKQRALRAQPFLYVPE